MTTPVMSFTNKPCQPSVAVQLPQQLKKKCSFVHSVKSSRRRRLGRVRAAAGGEGQESSGPFGFNLKDLGGTLRLKIGREGGPAEKSSPGTIKVGLGTLKFELPGTSKVSARKATRDADTVFVAGATGRLGARVVRELLAAGFTVRAGARSVDKAQGFRNLAEAYGLLTPDQVKRLQIVQCDLEDEDSIAPAIGNAEKVVSAIGAAEDDFFNTSAPRRIDGDAAIRLVQVADNVGVKQFVMVTSLGTGKWGWPAGALNLFWGVLIWKRRAEEALERSGMQYCIVRPGGMERPTDDYKKTHNLVLKPRDSIFGGQVSRLQVAELVAACCAAPELAENKCLEVVAESSAALRRLDELLVEQAVEIDQEEKLERLAVLREAEQQVEAADTQLEAAKQAGAELQQRVAELRQREAELRAESRETIKAAEKAEQELEELQEAAQQALRVEAAGKAVLAAAEKAGREGRMLSAKEIAQIQRPILNPPSEEELARQQAEEERAEEERRRRQGRGASRKGVVVEEEEEVGVATPQPLLPFFRLPFGAPQAEKEQEEEEEEEEEEEAVVVEEAKPMLPFFKLPFGGRKAEERQEEEEEEAAAPQSVLKKGKGSSAEAQEVAAEAPKPAFPFFKLPFGSPKAEDKQEETQGEAAAVVNEEMLISLQQQEQDKKAAAAAAKKAAEDAKRVAAAEAAAKKAEEAAKEKASAAEAAAKKVEEEAKAKAAAEAAAKKAEEDKQRAAVEAAAKKAEEEKQAAAKAVEEETAAKAAEEQEKLSAAKAAETQDDALPAANGTAPAFSNIFAGFKLPFGQAAEPEAGEVQEPAAEAAKVPENVREAREWIAAWRARNLEAALALDKVSAKQ